MVIVEELEHPLVVHVEVEVEGVLEIVDLLQVLAGLVIAAVLMVALVDNLILMEIIITGQQEVLLMDTAIKFPNLNLEVIIVMVVLVVEVVLPYNMLYHQVIV